MSNSLNQQLQAVLHLIDQIEFVKHNLKAWSQPQYEKGAPISLQLHGVDKSAAFTHKINDPFWDSESNTYDRPELNAATLAARDLIIQALQTELTRLEAELSTYTITKQ